jgi:hypothetical protein
MWQAGEGGASPWGGWTRGPVLVAFHAHRLLMQPRRTGATLRNIPTLAIEMT